MWKNSIEYLNIKIYLNFVVSFSKLENLSPLNPEILVKKLYQLSRNCTFSGGTFYFEPPCTCFLARKDGDLNPSCRYRSSM